MDIVSALKGEASKLQQQLDTVKCGHQSPGRKEQRCSSQETASLRKCTGKDVEGTKGAVGEDRSREEECLGRTYGARRQSSTQPTVRRSRKTRLKIGTYIFRLTRPLIRHCCTISQGSWKLCHQRETHALASVGFQSYLVWLRPCPHSPP